MGEEKRKTTTVEIGGGFGCLGTIAVLIVLWGLVFGFTWNGVKHGISCSCSKGVEVE